MSFEEKIGKFLKKQILYPNISSIHSTSISFEETIESQITGTIFSTKFSCSELEIKGNNIDDEKCNENLINLSLKEKTFIDCLFQIQNEANSSKDLFDCSKIHFESEELKFYNAIARVVHQMMHSKKQMNNMCEYYKNINNNCGISHENIDKLICKEKLKNKKLEFIAIKSIIISMTCFTTEFVKYYLSLIENNIENYDDDDICFNINCEIFNDIYKDYEGFLSICPLIERDFFKSFNCFREKYLMTFYLYDLFTDIFWNCIFHKKYFCYSFIQNFSSEKIDKCTQETFNIIINNLSQIKIPLKRQISELLDIRNQLEVNEKVDLLSILIKEKKIHNNIIFYDIKESLNLNNIINSKINPLSQEKGIRTIKEIECESFLNDNEQLDSIENIKYGINHISEDIKNMKKNIEQKEKEINRLKEEIEQEKSFQSPNIENYKNSNKNKINISFENKTLDEIFEYINSENDINEKSKNKRKHKKKNKKSIIEEINEVNKEYELDPIVEQFKNDLSLSNPNIQKIKPVISSDWLNSITLKSY